MILETIATLKKQIPEYDKIEKDLVNAQAYKTRATELENLRLNLIKLQWPVLALRDSELLKLEVHKELEEHTEQIETILTAFTTSADSILDSKPLRDLKKDFPKKLKKLPKKN